MKKLTSALIYTMAILLNTSAYAATVTGNVTAVIKKNISATETQPMNFGTISSTTSAGSVTLSTAGAVTTSLDHFGTTKSGRFTISADPSTPLTLSFSGGTLSSSANTMTLSNFTTNTPTTTDDSGQLILNVGADLAVGANQASGTYTGTYTITMSY